MTAMGMKVYQGCGGYEVLMYDEEIDGERPMMKYRC